MVVLTKSSEALRKMKRDVLALKASHRREEWLDEAKDNKKFAEGK